MNATIENVTIISNAVTKTSKIRLHLVREIEKVPVRSRHDLTIVEGMTADSAVDGLIALSSDLVDTAELVEYGFKPAEAEEEAEGDPEE